jgi:hypothetical protein
VDAEFTPQFEFGHQKHNHAMSCGKMPLVWCGHGYALNTCTHGCTICYHGLWDQDCFVCMREAMDTVIVIDG